MKPSGLHLALYLLPLGIGLAGTPVQAQITPETGNPTSTTININGSIIDIKNGKTAGSNLFHSFDQFNLDSGETANFQTNSSIQNILGRVVGGDASLINGLIQVTGGNANLFLMNPAGIIFGANAQLNVMGSFTATTANGIGLGSNWFNAIGNNNYASLTGTPNQFAFPMSQPGTIINSGNLSVLEGKNLNLFGGTVISTGPLTAPGGQINIASVAGGNVLRLSQDGMLLSLDIIPSSAAGSLPNNLTFSPLDLPALLTGGAASNATGVQKNADGSVSLIGSGYKIENGDLVATNATTTSGIAPGGGIRLLSNGSLNGGSLEALGSNVTLEAKGDITLGSINTFGSPGGDITITSIEGKIDITDLLNSYSNTDDAGNITIDANGDITATGAITGYSANGNATNITISSSNGSVTTENVAAMTDYGHGGNIEIRAFNDITTGQVQASVGQQGDAGSIILDAGGNIATDKVRAFSKNGNGGTIDITAGGDFGTIPAFAGGTHLAVNTNYGGDAGSITVNAGGNINAGGIDANAPNGNGGSISLTSGGNLTGGAMTTGSMFGDGGPIYLKAAENINIGETITGTWVGNAGTITIEVGGSITITSGAVYDFFQNNCGTSASGTVECNADGSVTLTPSETLSLPGQGLLAGPVKIIPIAPSGSSGTTTTPDTDTSGTTTTPDTDTSGTSGNSSQTSDSGTSAPNNGGSEIQMEVKTTDGREESVTNPTSVSSTVKGTAGEQTINATDDVNTGSIDARSALEGNGNNISVTSSEGGVTTKDVNSSAQQGNAGNIGVSGNNNVTVGNANASTNYSPPPAATTPAPATNNSPALPPTALGTSGSITITSNTGNVNTGVIDTTANVGTGGPVNLQGAGNVTAGDINTNVNSGNGGDVTATSTGGSITAGDINTYSDSNGSGGGVTATALQNVNLGNITASAGPATPAITSPVIATTSPSPVTATPTPLPVTAPANISPVTAAPVVNNATPTVTVTTSAPPSGPEATPLNAGGNVTITSTEGIVNVRDVNASAIDGPGGPVQIDARQNITTGDITTRSENQQAGTINLNSDVGRIVTGALDANSGPGFRDAQITLQARQGIITGPVLSDNIQIIGPSVSSSLSLQLSRLASNQPTVNQITTPIAVVETTAPTPAPIVTVTEAAPAPTPNPAPAAEPILDNSNSTTPPVSQTSNDAKNTTPQASPQIPNLNPTVINGVTAPATAEDNILSIEQERTGEYAEHFQKQLPNIKNFNQIREMLGKISEETNLKPAIIYVVEDQQGMWAVMVTDANEYSVTTIAGDQTVTEKEGQQWLVTTNKLDDLKEELNAFRDSVSKNEHKSIVVADGQKLYDLLIKPLEAKLQAQGINTLIFSMPESMRMLPIAALHDGQQFLVEKYKLAMIPSVSLMDTTYNGLGDGKLLAMGISDFEDTANVKQLKDLPRVNEELDAISSSWLNGVEIYRNEQATFGNLAEASQRQRFNMLHIATHAAFQNKDNNYIQFWDGQKHLEDLRQVQWYGDRMVELLVLSACETAVGNRDAEMGFAGLSVQAGVKTAIATLWKVSDNGTLGLMANLYQNLGQFPTKVEALQQAQIAMLRGEVKPSESNLDFTHPYYWAGFTLIGSPW
ncbi:MAG TPA: CHAT domain-containing protein [Oscillatoriaceae cyanobacterium M33_DOE_052]|nr:CHAT domain-containing protein [Oscillatoriaceae cyanobacterium M33_DOE_052]